jgi:hypothetical protein
MVFQPRGSARSIVAPRPVLPRMRSAVLAAAPRRPEMGWLWVPAVAGPSCRESGSLRPGQFNIEPLLGIRTVPHGTAYRHPLQRPFVSGHPALNEPGSLALATLPKPTHSPAPPNPQHWGKTAGIQNNECEWDSAELFRSRGPLNTATG